MAILEVTSKQFRDNQKTYFDLADAGKQIVIRRGHKQYTLTTTIKEEIFSDDIVEKIGMILEEDKIILQAPKNPRDGWEKYFMQMHENGDDKLFINDVFDDENFEEWE